MSRSIYGRSSINLTVDNLTFLEVTANDINATNSSITNLNATNLNVENFDINDLNVSTINISNASIDILDVSNQISASNGSIDNMEVSTLLNASEIETSKVSSIGNQLILAGKQDLILQGQTGGGSPNASMVIGNNTIDIYANNTNFSGNINTSDLNSSNINASNVSFNNARIVNLDADIINLPENTGIINVGTGQIYDNGINFNYIHDQNVNIVANNGLGANAPTVYLSSTQTTLGNNPVLIRDDELRLNFNDIVDVGNVNTSNITMSGNLNIGSGTIQDAGVNFAYIHDQNVQLVAYNGSTVRSTLFMGPGRVTITESDLLMRDDDIEMNFNNINDVGTLNVSNINLSGTINLTNIDVSTLNSSAINSSTINGSDIVATTIQANTRLRTQELVSMDLIPINIINSSNGSTNINCSELTADEGITIPTNKKIHIGTGELFDNGTSNFYLRDEGNITIAGYYTTTNPTMFIGVTTTTFTVNDVEIRDGRLSMNGNNISDVSKIFADFVESDRIQPVDITIPYLAWCTAVTNSSVITLTWGRGRHIERQSGAELMYYSHSRFLRYDSTDHSFYINNVSHLGCFDIVAEAQVRNPTGNRTNFMLGIALDDDTDIGSPIGPRLNEDFDGSNPFSVQYTRNSEGMYSTLLARRRVVIDSTSTRISMNTYNAVGGSAGGLTDESNCEVYDINIQFTYLGNYTIQSAIY